MTQELPDWLKTLQTPLLGETPGDHIVRIVQGCLGLSLKSNPEKLAELFLTNEPDIQRATQISQVATNCGTSMRCIWALAGCANSFITKPYISGQAISWLLQAAKQQGALIDCQTNPNYKSMIGPGVGLHFGTPGQNNDHMEWCLSQPDANFVALHGGGGRADNLISSSTGSVLSSLGRPLLHLILPEPMGATSAPDITIDTSDPIQTISDPPAPSFVPPAQPTIQSSSIDQIIQLIITILKALFHIRL